MLKETSPGAMAQLLGVSGESIRWGRGFAFLVALWISDIVPGVVEPLLRGEEFPPRWWWPLMATGGFVLTACALLAFRRVRNELAASVVAAIGYAVVMLPIRGLFLPTSYAPSRLVFSLLYVSLFLVGLVLAVRRVRPLWLGLAVGAAAGWLLDEIVIRIWFLAREPASVFIVQQELLSAVFLLISAAVFAGIFSAGVQMGEMPMPAAARAPAPPRARGKANTVEIDGQALSLFSSVEEFCRAVAARQAAVLRMDISDYAAVAQKVLGQAGSGASPRLLCAGCKVQFPGSFTLRLLAPEIFSGAIVLGASQAGQQFAQSLRCPRCGSAEALYVYDTPPTAGITQSDLEAIRHYWRHLAQQWWRTQSRAVAICDSCNADVPRAEGYLSGSSLYCESCCTEVLGAGAIEHLRQNPDYFGSGELQRARKFMAGG